MQAPPNWGAKIKAVCTALLGSVMLLAGLIAPVPSENDLQKVSGKLVSYSVEPDGSWFAQHLTRRRTVYVLFTLEHQTGRFWNSAVTPTNAASVLQRTGIPVDTFRNPHSRSHPINGNAERTYGLTVNGVVVEPVADDLAHDTVAVYILLPFFGAGTLGFAVWQWRRPNRQ
jgi:hypothetical protein